MLLLRRALAVFIGWLLTMLMMRAVFSIVVQLTPLSIWFVGDGPQTRMTTAGKALLVGLALPASALGGLMTTRLADTAPRLHGLVLAGVLFVWPLVSLAVGPPQPGAWALNLITALFSVGGALAGAELGRKLSGG